MKFIENFLEDVVQDYFTELGYPVETGKDYTAALQKSSSRVLLLDDLTSFLKAQYPHLGLQDADIRAIEKLFDENDENDFVANKTIYHLIRDGFSYTKLLSSKGAAGSAGGSVAEDGEEVSDRINLIDFNNRDNNIFKVIRQQTYKGTDTIRTDLVVYINGFPLVILELKSPIEKNATTKVAYDQVCKEYRTKCPNLLKFNAFVVLADGASALCGTHFSSYSHFKSWNRIELKPNLYGAGEQKQLGEAVIGASSLGEVVPGTSSFSEVNGGVDGFGQQVPAIDIVGDSWSTKQVEEDSSVGLYRLIHGMFNKDHLLHLLKNFIIFGDSSETKILCRYPQFYGATLLHDHIVRAWQERKQSVATEGLNGLPGFEEDREHKWSSFGSSRAGAGNGGLGSGNGGLGAGGIKHGYIKGGTYWGATGCGKSLTMLFLSRLLTKNPILKNPTIVVVTDRTDLDQQLAQTFGDATGYTEEKNIHSVESRADLIARLNSSLSHAGIFLTTIQKFTEETGLLSERENIICIFDEAHRSSLNTEAGQALAEDEVRDIQGYAASIHAAFPNAVYVGFTGTPIDKTIEVYGEVVDSYSLSDSVRDKITVPVTYDGHVAEIDISEENKQALDDCYNEFLEAGANPEQVEASKRAMAKVTNLIGAPKRLARVAEHFVHHYEQRVADKATTGKAMFVCSNRKIAYDFYQAVLALRPEWGQATSTAATAAAEAAADAQSSAQAANAQGHPAPAAEVAADAPAAGSTFTSSRWQKTQPTVEFAKMNLVMSSSEADTPELKALVSTDYKELARQFKDVNARFDIAIVVDMWLTGFDSPALDTIYIDKVVKMANLVQTISRVNRTYEHKEKGLVVDYIGIFEHLQKAMRRYGSGSSAQPLDLEKVEEAYEGFKAALAALEDRFAPVDKSGYLANHLYRKQAEASHEQAGGFKHEGGFEQAGGFEQGNNSVSSSPGSAQELTEAQKRNPFYNPELERHTNEQIFALVEQFQREEDKTLRARNAWICLTRAADFVLSEPDLQDFFKIQLRILRSAFKICNTKVTEYERALHDFYSAVNSMLFKITKADAPDLSQMNSIIGEILEEAIESAEVKDLNETNIDVELLSLIDGGGVLKDTQHLRFARLVKLLQQVVKKVEKVNLVQAKLFSERLEKIIDDYNQRGQLQADVLQQIYDELRALYGQIGQLLHGGQDQTLLVYIDLLKHTAEQFKFADKFSEDKYEQLAIDLREAVEKKGRPVDWENQPQVVSYFKLQIKRVFTKHDYPPGQSQSSLLLDQFARDLMKQISVTEHADA